MKTKWTKKGLEDFERRVINLFESGYARCPIHLSGGNEDELITLFQSIKSNDYIFSTHRNHYHYLLKGGDAEALISEIKGSALGLCKGCGRSMNVYDPKINFYSSAIVGGNCAMAIGVGLALKKKKAKSHVWCFVGDGATDGGHFMEAVRFGHTRHLPVTFVVEDNDKSVDSSAKDRWHNPMPINASNIIRYEYTRVYPHVGIGRHVTF